jgi:hypothetical protein
VQIGVGRVERAVLAYEHSRDEQVADGGETDDDIPENSTKRPHEFLPLAREVDVGQFGESYERAELDALKSRESNVHYFDLVPAGDIEIPMWKPETRRVGFHMRIDLRAYEHVEIDARTDTGERLITFRDVACDPHDGNLYSIRRSPSRAVR